MSGAASPAPSLHARRWRRAAAGVAALGLALLVGVALWAVVMWQQLPPLTQLTDYQPKVPLRIFTADGVQIGEFGSERRRFVALAETPKLLVDALLATEDADFWTHPGLDLWGMVRALLNNLRGQRLQGASTLTQQLARGTYLSNERSLKRKLLEMLLALKMERELSKEQILEIYMNQIFMGNRAYGFGAAAERYFGKDVTRLSTAEIALLVGLPQNPVHVNPVVSLPRALKRQQHVLRRMVAAGLISPSEADAARDTPLVIKRPKRLSSIADHAAEMVRAEVVARFGEDAYQKGLSVTTTLLAEEQRAAQLGLRRALFELERRQTYRGPEAQIKLPDTGPRLEAAIDKAFDAHPDLGELRAALVLAATPKQLTLLLSDGTEAQLSGEALRALAARLKPGADQPVQRGSLLRVLNTGTAGAPQWLPSQAPRAEGAVVNLDPKTGAIRALVGGFDFARGQFNHATQAYRQPGSSFKPFIYSALIEQGGWSGTQVSDQPFEAGDWTPRNYDGTYEESLTLRQAIARSKNMVSIRIVEHMGAQRARRWAAQFGLDLSRQPENLTLALGTGAVTPLQMASAYSVFASGGLLRPVWLIQSIKDASGAVLFKAEPAGEAKRAISERNAFMTNQLLSAVMREGTGARGSALLGRWDLYGKTGTTNDAVDAWFAGFHTSRVGVVWIGYPQPKSLGERETGGGLALPVWVAAMQPALKGQPMANLKPPDGLLEADGQWFYDEFSGELALQRIGFPPVDEASEAASEPASDLPTPKPPASAASTPASH